MDAQTVLYAQIGSNVVALILLAVCWRRPGAGRWLFFALFAWAGPWNLYTVWSQPEVYLDYAGLTWSELYRAFILGYFARHTQLLVSGIALGQIVVAALVAGWGRAVRVGLLGAVVFLLAITPLGRGAGFPFTLIAIAAAALLWRRPWPESLPGPAWRRLRGRP